MEKTKTRKRLAGSVALIVVLSVCLLTSTIALAYTLLRVDNNLFATGKVDIALCDESGRELGEYDRLIEEDEFLFEPGMTVKKAFSVKNKSTCEVYYLVYMSNVGGSLADVLQVSILEGNYETRQDLANGKVLFRGTPSQLKRDFVKAADSELKIGAQQDLTLVIYFPEHIGNEAQNGELRFSLCAEATQVRNNLEREFN